MLDAPGEAVIAVDDALAIRYCNARAQAVLFGGRAKSPSFHGLPRELASAIYTTLKKKRGRVTGKLELSSPPEKFAYSTDLLPGPVVIAKLSDRTEGIDAANGAEGQRLLRRVGRQLSNELKNGLTSVTTCAQLLAMKRSAPNELKEMGDIMSKDVHRLGRLSDNLYILSKARLEFSDVSNVAEVLKAAWEKALSHADRPCRLEQSGSAAEASIACDRRALEVALAEIFLNAIQAGASEAAKPITCAVNHHDDVVSILVKGPGPWVEDSRIGEAFFSTKAVGVGLGLTVAKKVITDHSGKLSVDTERGVEIELPTADD